MFLESSPSTSLPRRIAASILLVAFGSEFCFASPAGQTVVSGNATFNTAGAKTTIRASDGAIINYSSFNIARGETVQFLQPDAASRVLNRVTSGNPTQIFGSLLANGNVYLVNSAGLYFANGAVVNVGGLFAAAGRISDADFLSKTNRFNLTSSVVNEGLIQANGHVSLLGNAVSNSGAVRSTTGMVTMVSGDDVLVGERGSNIFVNAGPSAKTPSKTGVTNTGNIEAQRVLLGAGDYLGVTVNTSGLVKAKDVTVHSGAKGKTMVSGKVDASTNVAGQTGGNVQVLGDKVSLLGADISANGQLKGGQVRIGGDFQGKGDLQRASETVVDAATTLSANGLGPVSDGGSVVIWSDKVTTFRGLISARGGAKGGLGGSAEVSSKGLLRFEGKADLWSATGKNGTLLLDPDSIEVGSVADVDGLGLGNDVAANIALTDYPGQQSKITSQALSSLLENADVSLEAVNTISVTSAVSPTTGTQSLTLKAPAITLSADVTTGGAQIYDGAVTLGASRTLSGSGVTFTGAVSGAGYNLTLSNATNGVFSSTVGTSGVGALGAVTIGGNATIGGAINATSVSVTGTTGLNADVTTTGAQTYTGAVTLGASRTLSGSGVTFTGAVSGAGYNLTLSNATNGVFSSTVGTSGVGALGAVTIGGNATIGGAINATSVSVTGTTGLNADVTTTGAQTYTGAVTLGASRTLSGSGVTFTGAVSGAGYNLTLSNATNGVFSSTVGTSGVGALGAVTIGGNATIGGAINATSVDVTGTTGLNADVTTTGAQTYTGAVTLGASRTLSGSGVTFTGAVSGAGYNLTLSNATNGVFSSTVGTSGVGALGAVTIGGNATIGGAINATSVSVTGTTGLNADVTTTGAQTYTGAVTLGASRTLSGSGVTFTGAVSGAGYNLTLSNATNGVFSSTVGTSGVGALGAVTIGGNATIGGAINATSVDVTGTTGLNADVTTTGAQTYTGAVTLGASRTLSGSGVTFTGAVSGAGYNSTLSNATNGVFSSTVGTSGVGALGAVTIGGNATIGGAINATSVDVTGTTGLNADVTTTGAQTYTGAVTLGASRTLSGSGVTFTGAVSGAGYNLTLSNATNGVFSSTVGTSGVGALGAVTIGGNATIGGAINATSVDVTGTTGLNADVTTTGAQTYTGAVTLGASRTLSGSGVTFTGAVSGAGYNLTLSNATNGVFSSTVGTSGVGALGAVTIGGNATIGGAINATSVSVTGTTGLNADVTTTGAQTYTGAVTLGASRTLSGSGVTFTGAVSGAGYNLTLSNATNGVFSSTVGTSGVGALGAVTIGGNATIGGAINATSVSVTGTTGLNADVTTTGAQTYTGAVTLGASRTLSGSGVTFTGAVSGAGYNLTLSNATNGVFSSTVGTSGVGALGAVTIGGNATIGGAINATSVSVTGTTGLNADVTTTGAQTYTGAVTLGASRTLSGSGVTFTGAVSGAGYNLTLSNATNGVFSSTVGTSGVGALGAVTIGGNATIGGAINATSVSVTGTTGLNADVTTTGAQTYTGAVTLGADVTLTGTNLTFSTIDGAAPAAQSLVVNADNKTTFNGSVGATKKLTRLETDAAGSTEINASALAATAIDFKDTVVLKANSTVSADTVSFRKTLDADANPGGRSLKLNVSKLATFGDAIGGNHKLNNLEFTSPVALTTNAFSIAYSGVGDFHITALGEFSMGQGEKLINPSGGLSLTAGRKITLGDVVVNGVLKVDPPEGTYIYGRNSTGAPGDTGVNIIAKSISFDRQIQFVAGTPQKVNFETESGSVTGLVEAPGISFYKTSSPGMRDAYFAGFATNLNGFLSGGLYSALLTFQGQSNNAVAGGQKFLREAEALAGALAEQAAPELFTEATITAAKMQQLRFLGIHPRLATSDELQSISERRGYLAQLIRKLEAEAQEYQVVVNRVTRKQVDDLLASYDALFYKNEGGAKVDRHAELQQGFVEVYNAYLATGAQSPARFKSYLEAQASKNAVARQVLEDMNKARELFNRLDRMGLTPWEAQLSKESLILGMGIDVMTPRELRNIIEPQGSREVPLPAAAPEAANKPESQSGEAVPAGFLKKKKNTEALKPAAKLRKKTH